MNAATRDLPAQLPTPAAPPWLDANAYPFASRFTTIEGHRLHYVDEGAGPPIVFVHGTPSWSWEYRHLIRDLSSDHRCICLDHLGFGLSDHPTDAPYTPADHARRLALFLDSLDLQDATFVVHDFGGPIGLSYVLDHPARARRLVIMNTWMWGTADLPQLAWASRFFATWFGRWLYLKQGFSARVMLRVAWGRRTPLTPTNHAHYLAPFPTPESRMATWVLARELGGSSAWYASLWARRALLHPKPTLLLWGAADTAFDLTFLGRWRAELPQATVVEIAGAGHFPQEEAPDEVITAIRAHLRV